MEEKCMGLKNEVALQEKQTGDVDRQLDETTRELHREREKLMAVIRMSGDLIFEYDIVNDKMYYAGPGEGILYSRQITEGYTDQLLKEAGNRTETVEQQLAEALRSGKPDIYIELCKTDAEGKPRWVKVIGQTFYDEKGEPERVLGKVCDIDDQKKKEWELREKSQKDSLTGLLNNSTIKQQIGARLQSLKRGQTGYLVVQDVDSFKKINDTNGHLFGDAVLCSFADELSNIFPEALKGRIGGDEFVFYVEDMDREQLEEKLKQLNRCMSDRYDDDKTGLHISCSLGAAVTDGTVTDYNLLFQWADAALYQVKSREKGAYDLLEKKHGSCVVTASNTISQGAGRMDLVDLLNNIGDEKRILKLVNELDSSSLSVGNSLYVSTKYALARWVRRVSASWAANGVRINAIAPGNVNTAMTATMSTTAKMALNALPIPTKFGLETLMDPEEIAEVMIFLVSHKASGINGNIMFVDGGTDALLNSEKVY